MRNLVKVSDIDILYIEVLIFIVFIFLLYIWGGKSLEGGF